MFSKRCAALLTFEVLRHMPHMLTVRGGGDRGGAHEPDQSTLTLAVQEQSRDVVERLREDIDPT